MTNIQRQLFDLQDIQYRSFQQVLIPTVPPDRIIGVRVPDLRNLAKKFSSDKKSESFLHSLPHYYYEENNIHIYLINNLKDFNSAVSELESFLPYIDNWATCDNYGGKVFKKNHEQTYPYILKWIKSKKPFTVRYGIGLLMSNYLNEYFSADMPEFVVSIKSDNYYVNMMCAWYMATALAKQKNTVLPYFTEFKMNQAVHSLAVKKAIESFRIDDRTKSLLRSLKK